MNPFLIVGLVAGAYYLGRQLQKPKKASPPLPQLPPPPPLEGSGEDYAELWAALPYAVEVYPAGAVTDFAPPPENGAVAGTGCRVIAVADGWWDRVGTFVQGKLDEGVQNHAALQLAIVKRFLPGCVGLHTLASQALRAEVADRLAKLVPPAKGGFQTQPGSTDIDADSGGVDIQIPLPQGAEIQQHVRASGAVYTIIVIPKRIYNAAMGQSVWGALWRAWKGNVVNGNPAASGIRGNFDDAFAAARVAIELLPVSNRRRTGRRLFMGGWRR